MKDLNCSKNGDGAIAGTFTKNIVAAAPVIFCKQILAESTTVGASHDGFIVLFSKVLLLRL